ncbi:MAG: hypothetical protein ACU826_01990, partial [Gammaproteobacteria bacterium]
MAVALASRFWRLGCPKIIHEVATRLILFFGQGNPGGARSPAAILAAEANENPAAVIWWLLFKTSDLEVNWVKVKPKKRIASFQRRPPVPPEN